MNMKRKHIHHSIVSLVLVLVLCMAIMPIALAGQVDEYHDPAEHWVVTGSRTNEFDVNAVVMHETYYCTFCEQRTDFTVWRVPEYSRDGKSALTRNIKYSDGTWGDGVTTGTILDGVPGVSATYTGYHWGKSCCSMCGNMNSNDGIYEYPFNKNVYRLYDCSDKFWQTLPSTTAYEYADSTYHTTKTTGGSYCGICYGTRNTSTSTLERHTLKTEVVPQQANGRFVIIESCTLCDYEKTSYVAAKSVVADYFGTVDGQSHTISVTDLSESGVTTKIRYGNSADNCTLTSAPNYTDAGQYPVFYEITYSYKNTDMTDNGVAYVWLNDNGTTSGGETGTCACGCGDADCGCQKKDCTGDCCEDKGCGENHNFVLLDSIEASCLTLGYDRYFCTDCGKIEKRDYTNALGHAYQSVTVRESTCETDGKLLEICSRCGDLKVTETPKGEHSYATHKVEATCVNPGYTVRECEVCGDRQITDITSALTHNYQANVIAATCESGGKTIHTCDGCGSSFVTDYTAPLGHAFGDSKRVTNATCTTEGIVESRCTRCNYLQIETEPALGHTPGKTATCTEPQLCTVCGVVIAEASGHDFQPEITEPTCTEMGYTTFTCAGCNAAYKTEYTLPLGHDYAAEITAPTCTERGFTTYTCTRCDSSYVSDYTEPTGHEFDEGTKVTNSSCNNDGLMEFNCVNCDYHYLAAISANGHTLGEKATCTTPQLCEKCGAVIENALGHDYEIEVTDPTCTEIGYTTYTCNRCGITGHVDPTDPIGHNYRPEVTAPTCLERGYTTFTCANCGDAYVTDYTEPTGHIWDEGTVISVSTCNGEGVTEYRCTVCDYHRLEAESALGHTPGKAATCTEPQLCTVCGAVLKNAIGHEYTTKVTAPTCTEMGYTTNTCTHCGDSYRSDYVDAAGHKIGDWIVDTEPTTDNEGSKHRECEICGKTLEIEPIEKIKLFAYTDVFGEAVVGDYLVIVTDTSSDKAVHNAAVTLNDDGTLSVVLPENRLIDYAAQTTVTVQRKTDKIPVSNIGIVVTDKNDNYAPGKTDADGKLTVPATPANTSADGKVTIGGVDKDGNRMTLTVKVEDFESHRPISNAEVEVKNGVLHVTLPDGTDMDAGNRILVTVLDNTKTPVSAFDVTVRNDLGNQENGQTNKDGKLIVPALNKASTDDTGTAIVGKYTVIVTDSAGTPIKNALVTLDDTQDAFTVLLPEVHLLDAADQTTVTVLLPSSDPAVSLNVTVMDSKDNHASKDTNDDGQIVVPDANGSAGETIGKDNEDNSNTVKVTVTDKTDKEIAGADISIADDGNVTVKLPDDFAFESNDTVTVTVTDNNGEPKKDVSVTVTDGAGVTEDGTTDERGKLTVPADVETAAHAAYVVGYPDGTFGPERSMTRAEAATIFARLLAAKNGDTIYDNVHCSFSDVSGKSWYAGYVKYLETFGIINGYEDGTFRPEQEITRAEFVTMAVRFCNAYGIDTTSGTDKLAFTDVSADYWAADSVEAASANGWIIGYGNGTFAPDNDITRAEVVTIVGRVLGREADKAYIAANVGSVMTFSDVPNTHWAYYAVIEAANTHTVPVADGAERWLND